MAENVFLITGDDETAAENLAAKIVHEHAGENPDAFRLEIFRENENKKPEDLLRDLLFSLQSPPFLGGRKTIWLRNFSRFGAEGGKNAAGALPDALRQLAEQIKQGIPEDIVLVMNGPGVDGRKALYKSCKTAGAVLVCKKPDRLSRNWREEMTRLVEESARNKGLDLPASVVAYLVEALGSESSRIGPELEKLICYCGGTDAPVTLEAVREICPADGEAVSWELQDRLARRDIAGAFQVVDRLSRSGRDENEIARGLVIQLSRYFRHLIQARALMDQRGLRSGRDFQRKLAGISPEQKDKLLRQGFEIAGFHPYRAGLLGEAAQRFSEEELVRSVRALKDAYRRCVSSGVSARMLLDRFLFEFQPKPRPRPSRSPRRAGRA